MSAPEDEQGLTPPEASVLDDARQHGVVKVDLWRLPDRPPVGLERLEAAARLSRAGLLFPTGEQTAAGVHCRKEEYVPTPRARRSAKGVSGRRDGG